MRKQTRKPLRLKTYSYNQNGAYHITICTKAHAHTLCSVVGQADPCLPQIQLTSLGNVVKSYIDTIHDVYPYVFVDHYVIMPNHIHLLLRIDDFGAQRSARPISHIVRALKVMVRKQTGLSPFQTSFFEHIIRGQQDYQETWQYIENNPIKWCLPKGDR